MGLILHHDKVEPFMKYGANDQDLKYFLENGVAFSGVEEKTVGYAATYR
jgi:hypothetical protein